METVRPAMTEEQAEALMGSLLGPESYDRVVNADCDLRKPDGSPLLVLRRNAVPLGECRSAYRAFRRVNFDGGNRGYASGTGLSDKVRPGEVGLASKTRLRRLKKDGTVSNTSNAVAGRMQQTSGIIGYFDRNARYPYCRLTAFNLDRPEAFAEALPFIRSVDGVFARELPGRYAAQKAVAERTSPDFVIHGTAFTTVTVNRNWRTAAHKDAGDPKEGFGVLSVLRAGVFTGGLYVLPRWRLAVELNTRDVLLTDVHEVHGNTEIAGEPGAYERVSAVLYYRENMKHCGTAEQELEFAKNRKPGDPVRRARPNGA